jgi:hypothetical protein
MCASEGKRVARGAAEHVETALPEWVEGQAWAQFRALYTFVMSWNMPRRVNRPGESPGG